MTRGRSLCAALLVSACAQGPIYEAAPEPKPTDALIYVFRPQSFSGPLAARDAYFYVNDVNVADLSSKGYSWFHVPAGDYKLTMKWPLDVTLGMKDLNLTVRWLPGQKYYYRLDGRSSSTGITTRIEWRLGPVPVERGPSEISSCKYQPAFGVEKLLEQLKQERKPQPPGGPLSL